MNKIKESNKEILPGDFLRKYNSKDLGSDKLLRIFLISFLGLLRTFGEKERGFVRQQPKHAFQFIQEK